MDDFFDVFRQNRDGSVHWIGSADSLQSAKKMVGSTASKPSDQFVIHNVLAGESLYLRAGELLVQPLQTKVH